MLSLLVPLLSYHINAHQNFNQENYGFGLQVDNVGAMVYENSYNDTSVMLYLDVPLNSYAGVTVGGVTGYAHSPVLPVASLYVEYMGFNLALVPTGFVDYSGSDALVLLSYRIHF